MASCHVVCGAIDVDNNMEPPNSLQTFRFGEIFRHTGSILAMKDLTQGLRWDPEIVSGCVEMSLL